jgi:hypothetical protein
MLFSPTYNVKEICSPSSSFGFFGGFSTANPLLLISFLKFQRSDRKKNATSIETGTQVDGTNEFVFFICGFPSFLQCTCPIRGIKQL